MIVTVTVEFIIGLMYESDAKAESREMQYPNLEIFKRAID
jgi:hypothetical protein